MPTPSRATKPSTRNSDSSKRRAPSPRCSRLRARVAGERGDGRGDIVLAGDRLGEAPFGDQRGDRAARVDRLLFPPQGLIEPAHEAGAEAGGEGAARRVEDLADALEPDPVERRDGLGFEAERGQGQGSQHVARRARRHP